MKKIFVDKFQIQKQIVQILFINVIIKFFYFTVSLATIIASVNSATFYYDANSFTGTTYVWNDGNNPVYAEGSYNVGTGANGDGKYYWGSNLINNVETPFFGFRYTEDAPDGYTADQVGFFAYLRGDRTNIRFTVRGGGGIGFRTHSSSGGFTGLIAESLHSFSLGGLFTFGDGESNNLAYTIGISRNNTATNPSRLQE